MYPLSVTAALHEFYALRESDGTAASGLGLALAGQFAPDRPALWVRDTLTEQEAGTPCLPGLIEYGLDPARWILVRPRSATAVLQAGLEAARSRGIGGVLIELWGEARAYDLTASRRLMLAAHAAGTAVLMVRLAATPRPSAAETRWRLRAWPSRPLAARAPGHPVCELTLLRARTGGEGLSCLVEWNRNERRLVVHPVPAVPAARPRTTTGEGAATPLSRPVASLFAGRAESSGLRRTG